MPTIDPNLANVLGTLKLRDRIEVQWIDAHDIDMRGWFNLPEITDVEVICRVRTVGYFLCQRQGFVVICSDAQTPTDNLSDEFHTASAVPIGCIESVRVFADE